MSARFVKNNGIIFPTLFDVATSRFPEVYVTYTAVSIVGHEHPHSNPPLRLFQGYSPLPPNILTLTPPYPLVQLREVQRKTTESATATVECVVEGSNDGRIVQSEEPRHR